MKHEVKTTFMTLKKTLIPQIYLILRTTSDEKKTLPYGFEIPNQYLRFHDQGIFTTNLTYPWGAADTKSVGGEQDKASSIGIWWLFTERSSQSLLYRKHSPHIIIIHSSSLGGLFFTDVPFLFGICNCGLLFAEENASSKYELRFKADSWTPFVKWNRKRNIVIEKEVCSLAKFNYNAPQEV